MISKEKTQFSINTLKAASDELFLNMEPYWGCLIITTLPNQDSATLSHICMVCVIICILLGLNKA